VVRRRKIKKSNKAVILLICAGLVGTVRFAALIAIHLITSKQQEAYYASLSAFFVLAADSSLSQNAKQPVYLDVESDLAVLADSPPASMGKIRTLAMDFEAIRKEFPNTAAWIRINGTRVNYPVMYGTDNAYYLTRRPDGSKSRSGSIFIDYRNAPDFLNPNTFIYGHRMRSGAMFGMLSNYGSQSFYDKHPTVSILTPKGDYEVELFAGYTFNQMEETPPMSFSSAKALENYVRDAKRRSMFKSDVEVNFGDRLVTLCTCEYSFDEARLLVVGKLVEK